MTAGRRWAVAILLAVSAFSSSACIPTQLVQSPGFGKLPGLDPEEAVQAKSVSEGLDICRTAAWSVGGTLLVVVTLMTAGGIWFGWFTSVMKVTSGWFLWAGISAIAIASIGQHAWYSPDYVIRRAGSYLGDKLQPGDITRPYIETVAGTARASMRLRKLLAEGDYDWGERAGAIVAVAFLTSNPIGAWFLYLNSIAVLLMKMLLQASYAFLVAFYTMMGPLVAVTLIVPPWRKVFWAYLRLYLAIALWPAAWGLSERALDGIMEGWFRSTHGAYTSGDPFLVAQALGSGACMTFIANCIFFFVYLSVPVATTLLVNAAGRPFRDR